jgi:acetylornithine deacetylase/succinyl-diaminopimelate desuccinylase-like protein
MHAGMINGGKAFNSIADYAELLMDIRYIDGYDDKKILNIIQDNLVGEAVVTPMERGILMLNDLENKYFKLYQDILEKSTGQKIVMEFGTGASDSRFFCEKDKNVPVIVAMPIGGDAHMETEWLDVESLYKYLEIRKEFLNKLVSLS